MFTKMCPRCQTEKPATLDFFPPRGGRTDRIRTPCRSCTTAYKREKQREYMPRFLGYQRQKRAETGDVYSRRYYERHRDKILAKQAEYREQNREEIRERTRSPERLQKRNDYERGRRKSDPKAKIRQYLTSHFKLVLKKQLSRNVSGSAFTARFGYEPWQLVAHLERQFTRQMSWDNYGTFWQIDHIIPITSFRLPEETKQCWALTNLRPLRRDLNRTKWHLRTHLI